MDNTTINSPASIIEALRKLSPNDRRNAFRSMRAEFVEAEFDVELLPPPSPELIAEWDRRSDEAAKNSTAYVSWEEFEKELTERFGEQ